MSDDAYIRLRTRLQSADSYLAKVKGVIHVGANVGQERALYAAFGLDVIWVEPIPDVFRMLQANIAPFPRQRAYNYLLADDDRNYQLHIADNLGASSSILDFSKHTAMWPEIAYTESIWLQSTTLSSLLTLEQVVISRFDALVVDTQGSELKILRGGESVLPNFRFIKVEAPDFESYKGCCLSGELSSFLALHGFRERSRYAFKHMPGIGTYFDIVFERESGER